MWHRSRDVQRGIGDAGRIGFDGGLNRSAGIGEASHVVNRVDALRRRKAIE